MNQQEQARIKVLNSILECQLPIAQAAEIMGVSERHAKRLLAAYRRDGPAALSHGNRGRRPHNAVPESTAAAVVILAGEKYAGFNHSHLTEALAEREGIHLSHQTVSRLLNRSGLASARRHRPPKHRVRRERMPQEAMLVQINGSQHPWLEERGPRFVLLLAVYDATGAVAQAVFRPSEDTRGYLEALIRQWRIPLAQYSDRHAAFKYNARQGSVLFESTQFAQVAQELGNRQIFALSPQAKGRVERMAATFQDWLVTELRLAGAATMDQASQVLRDFLPRFNNQFAVASEHPETAYRPVPAGLSLTETISLKHTRKVARDNTVKYHWRVLLLLPGRELPRYAGLQVEVLELADRDLMVKYQGEPIEFHESPQPLSSLWGAVIPRSLDSQPQQVPGRPAKGHLHGHLNEAQRKLLAELESSGEQQDRVESVTDKGRATKGKPVRHQLHRTPTPTQQARWEAVQQAKGKGLSQRAIARKLGISRVTARKYALAESPPTNLLSARERARADAMAGSLVAAD